MNYDLQQSWNTSLLTAEARQSATFLHLSQLLNLMMFPIGIIVAIAIWQTKKDRYPALDRHGKMIVNFAVSLFVYSVVSFALLFVLVGLLGFLALFVMAVAFPIIGAVKANNGEFWEYPLTIKFLK